MADDSETEGSDARSDPYQEDRSPSPAGRCAGWPGGSTSRAASRNAPQLVERVAAMVTNRLIMQAIAERRRSNSGDKMAGV